SSIHLTSTHPPPTPSHPRFSNDTSTTAIYTLSLHDALPISEAPPRLAAVRRHPHAGRRPDPQQPRVRRVLADRETPGVRAAAVGDRKSTRLNSSHGSISYAVFCLKKKKKHNETTQQTTNP